MCKGRRAMDRERHWRRCSCRGVVPVLPILVAVLIGIAGGFGLVVYSLTRADGYCAFEAGIGMEIPTTGQNGNLSGFSPGSIIFTSTASGCTPPYTFSWTFGDGTYSNLPNVTHVYSHHGDFSGSIVISDSAGHMAASYFCIDAQSWPSLTATGGSSPPPCPW